MTSGTTISQSLQAIGKLMRMKRNEKTFELQSTYFKRYNPEEDQFIYFGDRLFLDSLYQSHYVVLSYEINDHLNFEFAFTTQNIDHLKMILNVAQKASILFK
ncbi:hypothetical protein M9Y10_026915 [Tritrichomonas musculus]|uniref:Uncharacterized protein n=1 Tax=Tritrichomonas musculus TaxID=1915356 RepID=A0ABR2H6W7_9EUKA